MLNKCSRHVLLDEFLSTHVWEFNQNLLLSFCEQESEAKWNTVMCFMEARVTLKFKFIQRENKAFMINRMRGIFLIAGGKIFQWHGIGSASKPHTNFFRCSHVGFCSPSCKHDFRLWFFPFCTKNCPGSVRYVCLYINNIPGTLIWATLDKIFTTRHNWILSRFNVFWRGTWTTSDLIYSVLYRFLSCSSIISKPGMARQNLSCFPARRKETRKNSFDVGSKNFSTLQIASGSN